MCGTDDSEKVECVLLDNKLGVDGDIRVCDANDSKEAERIPLDDGLRIGGSAIKTVKIISK